MFNMAPKKKLAAPHRIVSLVLAAVFSPIAAYSAVPSSAADMPLLLIGSSYENGATAIDAESIGALGGAAVGAGSYLSLGDAIIKDILPGVGLTVNEAAVGSTTFDRFSCFELACLAGGKMLGYLNQYKRALLRVALRDPLNPASIVGYNAKYIFIGMANDCIHSDAFGIPQARTTPCTSVEINASADRIIEVAKDALSKGITPIIPIHPEYKSLNLSLVQQGLGFVWVANEFQYNEVRNMFRTRFTAELPGALVVDLWTNFVHRGDGIHPDLATMKRTARKLKLIIRRHGGL